MCWVVTTDISDIKDTATSKFKLLLFRGMTEWRDVPTDVRWAGEPSAIVRYVSVVGDVDVTVVVAADGVLLTGSDERRISHSQQIVFTDKQRQHHV